MIAKSISDCSHYSIQFELNKQLNNLLKEDEISSLLDRITKTLKLCTTVKFCLQSHSSLFNLFDFIHKPKMNIFIFIKYSNKYSVSLIK